uniref:F-box protein AT5G49610-like beta-propeller domain-containing protein n=1 Tax=Arundo donax TaxID=35708 RepID=A0A0A9CYY7_ARUDO
MPTTYAIRSLLHPAPDKPLPQPPPSSSRSLLRNQSGTCNGRSHLLLEDDGDAVSCLCLYLSYNGEEIGASFSILQSGVWGVVRSSVTELPQRLFSTIVAQKLLVGSKFYIMTTLGYILGLDLTTASFFTVKLPGGARDSTTLKLSRPQHAGLYLLEAKGFQLSIWHGDGLELSYADTRV